MARVTSKYADWTRGQIEALLNIIGEEKAKKLLAGEISVEFKEVIKKLFDKHGRRIPKGLQANVCDPIRGFRLNQPRLETEDDFASRITRLHKYLRVDTGVTGKQLKEEYERLLSVIKGDLQIANITNGVCLPVLLPKFVTGDLGSELELYLSAIDKSYIEIFGVRIFHNYCKNVTLAGRVSVVDGSRYNQVISRMKQGPVIGLYFPNSLQGFSINASREQMLTLSKGFILSGLDIALAKIMYPDIFRRHYDVNALYNIPNFNLSSLQLPVGHSFHFFFTVEDELGFINYAPTDEACGDYSSGLLYIGY